GWRISYCTFLSSSPSRPPLSALAKLTQLVRTAHAMRKMPGGSVGSVLAGIYREWSWARCWTSLMGVGGREHLRNGVRGAASNGMHAHLETMLNPARYDVRQFGNRNNAPRNRTESWLKEEAEHVDSESHMKGFTANLTLYVSAWHKLYQITVFVRETRIVWTYVSAENQSASAPNFLVPWNCRHEFQLNNMYRISTLLRLNALNRD
ncbi:hypothetical protein C8J57DRAFT_1594393, partial [Mycena rebaudengoi]